jgi:hypothetical protein
MLIEYYPKNLAIFPQYKAAQFLLRGFSLPVHNLLFEDYPKACRIYFIITLSIR